MPSALCGEHDKHIPGAQPRRAGTATKRLCPLLGSYNRGRNDQSGREAASPTDCFVSEIGPCRLAPNVAVGHGHFQSTPQEDPGPTPRRHPLRQRRPPSIGEAAYARQQDHVPRTWHRADRHVHQRRRIERERLSQHRLKSRHPSSRRRAPAVGRLWPKQCGGTSRGPAPCVTRWWSAIPGSGRAGAGPHRGWQDRCRSRGMHVGGRADQQAVPVEDVPEQGGEIAAVADDGRGEFPPQRVAWHDPQVATDIGENGAGRAAADLGRDVPGRGQTGDAWFACGGAAVLGLGGARLARGRGGQGGQGGRLADGVADEPGLERGGAKQAAGDAREDLCDVAGAEVPRDVARSVAGVRCCSAAAMCRP